MVLRGVAGDVTRTVLEGILVFKDRSGALHEFEDHRVTGPESTRTVVVIISFYMILQTPISN